MLNAYFALGLFTFTMKISSVFVVGLMTLLSNLVSFAKLDKLAGYFKSIKHLKWPVLINYDKQLPMSSFKL